MTVRRLPALGYVLQLKMPSVDGASQDLQQVHFPHLLVATARGVELRLEWGVLVRESEFADGNSMSSSNSLQ